MPELAVTGSPTFNGDGSCTINATGSDRVRASSVYIDKTQSWIATRVKMNWSNDTAVINAQPFFFDWADAEGPTVVVARAWVDVDQFIMRRINTQQVVSHTFNTNDKITVIYAWTATEHKLSVNGAVFVSQATTVPPAVHSLFDIAGHAGGSNLQIEGDVFWFAAGTGTLTDTDAATIHGYGDDPLGISVFPGTPTMFWPANSALFYLPPPYINIAVTI